MKPPQTEPLGSHLGRALAAHLADVIVNVRSRMAPIEQSHRIDVNNAWLDDAEKRLQPLTAAILAMVPEGAETPEWAKMLTATAKRPKNQTDFLIYLFALVGAVITLIPALGEVAIQQTVNKAWSLQPDRPISPADAADMVERNILTEGEGASEAAQSGMNASRFAQMVLDTGEPPGIETMLRLYNRGGMDGATMDRMIAYSRIRTEWTQQVLDSYFTTMSGAAAIEAAIKGVIDPGTAKQLFVEDGGIAGQFDTLLAAAGDSIGVVEAGTLYNHGLIDLATYQAIILYSRINPRFTSVAMLQRHHWLGIYQIAEALKAGTATSDEATQWMAEDGYPADQIAAFVGAHSTGKVAAHKNISEAQAIKLFEAGEVNATEFATLLADLGYSPDEVPFVVKTYEAQKILASQAQAVTAVRKAFLADRYTAAQVSVGLDQLGVSAGARDNYIADWTSERDTQFRQLTDTQIGAAAKNGYITYATAVERWTAMGYSEVDAGILARIYGYTPDKPQP